VTGNPTKSGMTQLGVDICGLRLKNPTMLASGVLDETGKSMLAIAGAGRGSHCHQIRGTGAEERPPNPSVVELEHGLLNAMGLPNPGIDLFVDEIKEAKKGGVPIIGSVFGGTEEEIADLSGRVALAGADAVELNLSCPHAKGYGAEIGSSPELVESICRLAKRAPRCRSSRSSRQTPHR